MSNPRDSDRDLGAADRLAAEEADLRLDARLRQRLVASRQFVPAPSEAMLVRVREAARTQATESASGGVVSWLGARPKHMWAAVGSVVVGAAAVAGLVMLQRGNHGIDQQAAEVLERREGGLDQLSQSAPAAAPPSAGPALAAISNSEVSAQAISPDITAAEGVGPKNNPGLDPAKKSKVEMAAAEPPLRPEAGKGSASKFARAPAAELEESSKDAQRTSVLGERKGGVVGGVVGSAAASEVAGTDGAKQDAYDEVDRAQREREPARGGASNAAAASPPVAPATAMSAPKSTRASDDGDKLGIDAPSSAAPIGKAQPVDVASLAQNGRCDEAIKASASRRKSERSYTAARAAQDLAPCRKAAEQRIKAPAKTKAAPSKK